MTMVDGDAQEGSAVQHDKENPLFSGVTHSTASDAPTSERTLSGGQTESGELVSQAAPKGRWSQAGKKVKMALLVAGGFTTLRDRTGINEIKLEQLKTIAKLGEGAFAIVEQCEYTPAVEGAEKMIVAVKKLKPEITSQPEDLECFLNEVSLMRKLKHKHIVNYIGIGSSDNSSEKRRQETLFLVSEIMEGGTLKKLVMQQMTLPHRVLYTNTHVLRWCINMAEALDYLHNAQPIVIHRDLKLENILLKGTERDSQEAKLNDFGLVAFLRKKNEFGAATPPKEKPGQAKLLSKTMDNSYDESVSKLMKRMGSLAPNAAAASVGKSVKSSNGVMGIVRKSMASFSASKTEKQEGGSWHPENLPQAKAQLSGKTGTLMYMSPEMYLQDTGYTAKVDVFSFGVIMYELFHKYMMIFAISIEGTEEEIEQYADRVSKGYRPPISSEFHVDVRQLIADCWAQDPKDRPTMTEVVKRLRKIEEQGLVVNTTSDFGCGCAIM